MPAQDLKKLLERIHLRLDESFVGISSMVSDLAPADLAELFNQWPDGSWAEAATWVQGIADEKLQTQAARQLLPHLLTNSPLTAAARTRIFEQITQQHIDYMLSKIPRGRFVEVNEIAAMVAWLVSEENSFTTGAVFDLSGGRATY